MPVIKNINTTAIQNVTSYKNTVEANSGARNATRITIDTLMT